MRALSADKLKHNRRRSPDKSYPKPGTKVREVYDFFAAHKGKIVDFNVCDGHGASGRALADLLDYYGCDIRKVKQKRWIFAGEWFGRDYVSYFEPFKPGAKDEEGSASKIE